MNVIYLACWWRTF